MAASGRLVPLSCLNCSFWLGECILGQKWADIQPADGWKIFLSWMREDITMDAATSTMMICRGWVLDIQIKRKYFFLQLNKDI